MEKVKIGAITVGQSPRVDVTPDLWPIFGPNVELIEAGGLDGLSREEIETFVPEDGDYVLVSRLKDGSSVTFAERYVLHRGIPFPKWRQILASKQNTCSFS